MKTKFNLYFACLIVIGALAGAGQILADDWLQWRGPNRADRSAETGLLKVWPEGGPSQLWTNSDTGLGYGGISVAQGTVFTMGSRDETEFLIAIDAQTGKEKWAAEMGPLLENGWGNGPRSTPTIDGDRVYAMSGQGHLVCVERESGEAVWKKKMSELGGEVPQWGYSESPLVDENRVVVTPGGGNGAIAALDKTSGSLLWQTESINDGAHYSSIIVAQPHGKKQYVQLLVSQIVGIDPASGDVLWTTPFNGAVAVIPTPVTKDNYVYVTSGYGVGCKLIEISQDNQVKEIYSNKVMKNHHGGVILVGDKIFGHSDGAGWMCQDLKSGEADWTQDDLGKGCVTFADGMLYCVDEKRGQVALVEASDVAWKEKSRFKLSPQTKNRNRNGGIWTHPVISDGKLYLKDQEILYCYEVK